MVLKKNQKIKRSINRYTKHIYNDLNIFDERLVCVLFNLILPTETFQDNNILKVSQNFMI